MEIKIIDFERFPKILKEIPDPPRRLFVAGSLREDNETMIAIVGTRKASAHGIKIAETFARELSAMGFAVVSGLAMGIDTAAHRGALSGGGKTIAVLGNGLDKIYPAQNENLAQKIINQGGGIVSEYESGTPSYKHNFIQRNRIISGLASAVVIIEAPLRSGALATAGFAATQGREVFVIPGPVNHPNYGGSHALLRDGARLVTSPQDIIEDLGLKNLFGPGIQKTENSLTRQLNNEEMLILNKIKDYNSPLNVDKIIKLTKLEPQIVNQTLASLAIRGLIQEAGGSYTI